MTCQNKCNSTVIYPILCKQAVPLESVLPICWHLYHVQSYTKYLRFGQWRTAYTTVVP